MEKDSQERLLDGLTLLTVALELELGRPHGNTILHHVAWYPVLESSSHSVAQILESSGMFCSCDEFIRMLSWLGIVWIYILTPRTL